MKSMSEFLVFMKQNMRNTRMVYYFFKIGMQLDQINLQDYN